MTHATTHPHNHGLLVVLALALVALGVTPVTSRAAAPQTAPEFVGISHWLNSKPLSMKSLRGKVVLIDFWAYSCINCLRTLPHVTSWYDKYKDNGLVVIGVHAPEFEFEKSTANVRRAIDNYKIHYPVAQDNQMATWQAWSNRFWPAEYLVDRDGTVVMHHYGEGHYEATEQAIRKLLGLSPMTSSVADKDFSGVGSPEMYFGLARVANLANASTNQRYRFPDTLQLNQFALQGQWQLSSEYAQQTSPQAAIRLRFRAAQVNMVASSATPVTLQISVDGKPQPAVTVQHSRLYTLYQSDASGEHTIEIHTSHAGLKAFTFTFG